MAGTLQSGCSCPPLQPEKQVGRDLEPSSGSRRCREGHFRPGAITAESLVWLQGGRERRGSGDRKAPRADRSLCKYRVNAPHPKHVGPEGFLILEIFWNICVHIVRSFWGLTSKHETCLFHVCPPRTGWRPLRACSSALHLAATRPRGLAWDSSRGHPLSTRKASALGTVWIWGFWHVLVFRGAFPFRCAP